jgi:hypothetical protein
MWACYAKHALDLMYADGEVELAKEFFHRLMLATPAYFDKHATKENYDQLRLERMSMLIYSDDTVVKLPRKFLKYYNLEGLKSYLEDYTMWSIKEIQLADDAFSTLKQEEKQMFIRIPKPRTKTFNCHVLDRRGVRFLQFYLVQVKLGDDIYVMPYRDGFVPLAKMLRKATVVYGSDAIAWRDLAMKAQATAIGVGWNSEVYQVAREVYKYALLRGKIGVEQMVAHIRAFKKEQPHAFADYLPYSIASVSPDYDWMPDAFPTFEFVQELYLPTKFEQMKLEREVRVRL